MNVAAARVRPLINLVTAAMKTLEIISRGTCDAVFPDGSLSLAGLACSGF